MQCEPGDQRSSLLLSRRDVAIQIIKKVQNQNQSRNLGRDISNVFIAPYALMNFKLPATYFTVLNVTPFINGRPSLIHFAHVT